MWKQKYVNKNKKQNWETTQDKEENTIAKQ